VTEPLRLNRFLAASGVASRRKCEELILAGRVSINGQRVVELATRVDPRNDRVTLDGERVALPSRDWTIVLNKPPGYLVAASDARGRRTVMDLLGRTRERVFPIGRLDYASEGLLLFTNDGELAYRLAHPRFKVEKLYHVEVAGSVEPDAIRSWSSGVLLDDGPTLPAVVQVLEETRRHTLLGVQIREGRKRQIRRMFSLLGYEVTRLVRVRFGPLDLGDLAPGKWRPVRPDELRTLRAAAGLAPTPEGSA